MLSLSSLNSLELTCNTSTKVFHNCYIVLSAVVHGSHPDSRVRHWNAYMLFYEAVHPPTAEQPSAVTKSDRARY